MKHERKSHLVERSQDSSRRDANWNEIEDSLDRRGRHRAIVVLCATAAAALVAWWVRPVFVESGALEQRIERSTRPSPLLVEESPAPRPEPPPPESPEFGRVMLVEGSTVRPHPGALATVCEPRRQGDSCVRVQRGTVSFEVSKRPERDFVVRAADVVVRVVGTEFDVSHRALDGDVFVTSVTVREGVVEVLTQDGAHHVLRAGETWSRDSQVAATRSVAQASPSKESFDEPAEPVAGRARGPRAGAETPPQPSPRLDARALWSAALGARRAGDHDAEVAAYREMIDAGDEFPQTDLAALELGRVLLDVRNDPSSAIAPLELAVRTARRDATREDAMGRLVQARGDAGDLGECHAVRARYLAEFPQGVHAPLVQRACEP